MVEGADLRSPQHLSLKFLDALYVIDKAIVMLPLKLQILATARRNYQS